MNPKTDCEITGVIAQKVCDRCRISECSRRGPAVSGEGCACVITGHGGPTCGPGRIVLPGEPIRVPQWVRRVKYINGSFCTRSIAVSEIVPSPIRGCWDIELKLVFDFKLQLLGELMLPLEIICRCEECYSENESEITKDFIWGSVEYVKQLTLSGPDKDEPMVASDLIPPLGSGCRNTPHVLAEARAEPADFELVSPREACVCEDILDGVYHEPFNYVFAKTVVFADVTLFRLACLCVGASPCPPPKPCNDPPDACGRFDLMDFPAKDFSPK